MCFHISQFTKKKLLSGAYSCCINLSKTLVIKSTIKIIFYFFALSRKVIIEINPEEINVFSAANKLKQRKGLTLNLTNRQLSVNY